MKILIVYYSRTSRNKRLCSELQASLHCDIEEIIDKANRHGIINYLFAGRDAFLKRTTSIAIPKKDPGRYDLVIIGTPIWSVNITPAVRTYLRDYRHKLKKLAVVSLSGMGPAGKRILTEVEAVAGIKPIASLLVAEREYHQGSYKNKVSDFIQTITK